MTATKKKPAPKKKAPAKKKTTKKKAKTKQAVRRTVTKKKPRPKKPGQNRKRETKSYLTLDNLNERQKAVRQEMITTHGQVDVTALARAHGVDRTTIWRDRQLIARVPMPEHHKWDEQAAVQEAIQFYQGMFEYLLDELKHIHDGEIMVRNQGGLKSQTGKGAILTLMAKTRRDYNEFLMDVGMIRRAPTHLIVSEGELEGLRDNNSIKAAIGEVTRELAAMKKKRLALEKE